MTSEDLAGAATQSAREASRAALPRRVALGRAQVLAKLALLPERRSLVLLLLALSVVFIAGSDSEHFYRWDFDRGGISLNHLTVAQNRSYEHGFAGFYYQFVDLAGGTAYKPYNRFPIAGSLLLKAATLGFPDDIPAQIQAARMLMLTFFAATVMVAYFALRRLTASPSAALAAALLAFSSYYPLRYADLVATEGPMDLFGVMLTFHGLVVFAQQRRFGQLLAKIGVAVLIGWHVFALLLPIVALGLAAELLRGPAGMLRRSAQLLHSRHLLLGAVALSFGVSMLALNFGLEHATTTGDGAAAEQKPALAQLPSFQAVRRVLGLNTTFNDQMQHQVAWLPSLEKLLQRAGRVFIPYGVEHLGRGLFAHAADVSLPMRHSLQEAEASQREQRDAEGSGVLKRQESGSSRRVAGGSDLLAAGALLWGACAFLACMVAIAFTRYRTLMASLALCGLSWGLLVRGSVPLNAFEGMFLVGLPLAAYSIAFSTVCRLSKPLAHGCVGMALATFVFSGVQMWSADRHQTAQGPEFRSLVSDVETIRGIAPEGSAVVGFRTPARYLTRYLLTGRLFLSSLNGAQRHRADFVLTRGRTADDNGLLTPNNRHVFLYDRRAFDARYAVLGKAAVEGKRGWNIHQVGRRLIYTSGEDCLARQAFQHEPPFFLEAFPTVPAPHVDSFFAERLQVRRTEFRFHDSGFEVAGRCIAEATLPGYDIAKVRTGQFAGNGGVLWDVELALHGQP